MQAQRLGLRIFGGQLLVPLGGLELDVAGHGGGIGLLGGGQISPVPGHQLVGGGGGFGGFLVGVEQETDLLGFGGQAFHAGPTGRLAGGVERVGGLSQVFFSPFQGVAVAGQGIAPDGLGGQEQPAFHGHGQIGPWQAGGFQGLGARGQAVQPGNGEKPEHQRGHGGQAHGQGDLGGKKRKPHAGASLRLEMRHGEAAQTTRLPGERLQGVANYAPKSKGAAGQYAGRPRFGESCRRRISRSGR